MGIPAYFRKITQKYSIITNDTPPCTHLYLDYNGILHTSCARVLKNFTSSHDNVDEFEKAVIDDALKYTRTIIDFANPSKEIMLSIDGVAPLAKINQQRKRRYLSVFAKTQMKNNHYSWDSNAISPGTGFMNKVSIALRNSFTNSNVIISDSNVVGEGEHKIYNKIAEFPDGHHVVYGLDADLIMLGLISPAHNIHLMREPVHFSESHARSEFQETQFLFLDVQTLRSSLKTSYPALDPESYVILAALAGNDFLPTLSHLSIYSDAIDRLIHVYLKDVQNRLVYRNDIGRAVLNISSLTRILSAFVEGETEQMRTKHSKHYSMKTYNIKTNQDRIDNYGLCNRDGTLANMMIAPNWRMKYYEKLFGMNRKGDETIRCACSSFINGLHWITDYYLNRENSFCWMYPYIYSPTIMDLHNHLLTSWSAVNLIPTPTISAELQLLLIMPIQSQNIVPSNVLGLMVSDKSPIRYMFPRKFDIETYGKVKLHECSPKLPVIEINEFISAYRNWTS